MVMLRVCFLICLEFIAAVSSIKCYTQKCETRENEYTKCDQETHKCTEYSWYREGSCEYLGYAHSSSSFKYCSVEKCQYDHYGEAFMCHRRYESSNSYGGMSSTTIGILAIVGAVAAFIVIGLARCYWQRQRSGYGAANHGVIVTQPVTHNQAGFPAQASYLPPSPNPATGYPPATYPPATYPPAQYPPAQYPPAQYPPAQYPPAQCPPTQYPPAQYPPTQFPPVQYPPTQNPPSTAYPAPTAYPTSSAHPPTGPPPSTTEIPNTSAHASNPTSMQGPPPPPGENILPPSSFEVSGQPAENPYVEAFRQ